MKKLVAVLAIVAVGFGFTSCKKECTCKEKNTGLETPTIKLEDTDYKSCKEMQKAANDEAKEQGVDASWTCS
jgi:hypothetical protein